VRRPTIAARHAATSASPAASAAAATSISGSRDMPAAKLKKVRIGRHSLPSGVETMPRRVHRSRLPGTALSTRWLTW